jgi:hypothetical protein
MIELKKKALRVESEKPLAVYYDDKVVGNKIPSILSNKIQERSKEGGVYHGQAALGENFVYSEGISFCWLDCAFFIALPFGLPVVGDMRLNAFRKGEQLVEYLVLLSAKYNLNRRQLKHVVARVLDLQAERKAGASADNADTLRFGLLKAWQIEGLRVEILKLLEK